MKYTSIALVLALAACSESKPAPKQAQTTAPTELSHVVDAPTAASASAESSEDGNPVSDTAKNALAAVIDEDGDAVSADPNVATEEHAAEAEPEAGSAPMKSASKSAASSKTKKNPSESKSGEPSEAATEPTKSDEVSVQVLQEGTGRVVKMGDTVTLEYTISYVPKPETEKKDDPKKKGAKKPEAKKPDPAKTPAKSVDKNGAKKPDEDKTDEAKPKEGEPAKNDAAKSDEPKGDAAKSEAPHAEGDKVEKHADPDHAKTDEGGESHSKPDADGDEHQAKTGKDSAVTKKPSESKTPDAKAAEPLQPIILASTKSLLTPFTVTLSHNSKPKLIPGLVQGVEGLKVGSRARLIVPAALAYGKDGNKSAGIPPETPVEIEVFVKDARE